MESSTKIMDCEQRWDLLWSAALHYKHRHHHDKNNNNNEK